VRDRLLRLLARSGFAATPLVRLVGRRRTRGVDAALDPQIAALLEAEHLLRLPALDTLPPAAARAFAAEGLGVLDVDDEPMAEVIDLTVPGPAGPLPVRIYQPGGAGPGWIIYFHGGGGVIGSIASSDAATRLLAARSRCTIATVGYRLAPEHPHPASIHDACAAYDALCARIPAASKIAVAGDSFGGYLAAHVERHARRGARPPALQALIYPLVDLTLTSPTIEAFAEGYLLTRATMHYFRDHYIAPHGDLHTPSPLFWDDVRGAAPALIIEAGFDPLLDEDRAYASKLRAAGVPVMERCHPGLVHGFLSFGGVIRAARAAIEELAVDLARELGDRSVR
jgi:acetyl esterase